MGISETGSRHAVNNGASLATLQLPSVANAGQSSTAYLLTYKFTRTVPYNCMQCNARYCCRNSVRLSVRLSVCQMRVL